MNWPPRRWSVYGSARPCIDPRAYSRVNPLPQVQRSLENCAVPVVTGQAHDLNVMRSMQERACPAKRRASGARSHRRQTSISEHLEGHTQAQSRLLNTPHLLRLAPPGQLLPLHPVQQRLHHRLGRIQPDSPEPPHNVTKRMGGDCARVGQPGIKETGAHGGAPRTAAIKRNSRAQKSANCIAERALVRLDDCG